MMRGIYYIASGNRYRNEAITAIKRTKEIMPNIPIALCTDVYDSAFNDIDHLIIMQNSRYCFLDKVSNYFNSPFDQTIFLDTDTYVVDSIESLFTLLNRFDIAAPHAPIDDYEFVEMNDCFTEINSGVIAYNKNIRTSDMFNLYEQHYLKSLTYCREKYNDIPPDQPSFRYAVYNSQVNFCFLSHQYNCMIDFPCFLSGAVHILHGHYNIVEMGFKERIINASTENRLYDPQKGILK